jgi:hypothetical protein
MDFCFEGEIIFKFLFRSLEKSNNSNLPSTYPYAYNIFTANSVNLPILLSFMCDGGIMSFMIVHVDSPYDIVQQTFLNTFPLAHNTSDSPV